MIAAFLAATALATSPAQYLQAQQRADGGFGGVQVTAWATLGLRAVGAPTAAAAGYLVAHEDELRSATDVELAVAAEAASGTPSPSLVARLHAFEHPDGSIGPLLNSTIWGAIALAQAGETVPAATVRFLVGRQARSGGWSWIARGAPDSNDTAAAIEALRAAGVAGTPVRRGLAFLRTFEQRDGGFELARGRGSDTQSTAWAIQAFLAARATPPAAAYRYLARMRRGDGSLRYSARSSVTPVWVTAQALPALAGKPFPLR
jgi:Prenyltransferase and squalene oxidase repeat